MVASIWPASIERLSGLNMGGLDGFDMGGLGGLDMTCLGGLVIAGLY